MDNKLITALIVSAGETIKKLRERDQYLFSRLNIHTITGQQFSSEDTETLRDMGIMDANGKVHDVIIEHWLDIVAYLKG